MGGVEYLFRTFHDPHTFSGETHETSHATSFSKSAVAEFAIHVRGSGVGVSRIVAAAIEQNNDEHGIIWPAEIAPFKVVIVPMNMHKSESVAKAASDLYEQLIDAGVEVLFDDRKERAGVMFADMELIGIPHTVVIGQRSLDNGVLEYKSRKTGVKEEVAINDMVDFIKAKLA